MRASKITAVDFFDDLTSRYARRRFIAGFSTLIAVCILFLWFAEVNITWPIAKDVVSAILVEIIASAFIIVMFYLIYVYFIGSNAAAREVNVTRPQDIGERMRALPQGVRQYVFWGRSGSFFRAFVIHELDRQAREDKRHIVVHVLLPDPDNKRLVQSYREILKMLGEESNENPLLPNVLATCMTCAIIASNNKHIEIRVHLSQFLPAFRVDLSDNGAILTQDDKKKSALYFNHGSEFWDMFQSTVANERAVSRAVTWSQEMFAGLKIDERSCNEQTLKSFGINVGNVEAVQREVAQLITKRPHRYV